MYFNRIIQSAKKVELIRNQDKNRNDNSMNLNKKIYNQF